MSSAKPAAALINTRLFTAVGVIVKLFAIPFKKLPIPVGTPVTAFAPTVLKVNVPVSLGKRVVHRPPVFPTQPQRMLAPQIRQRVVKQPKVIRAPLRKARRPTKLIAASVIEICGSPTFPLSPSPIRSWSGSAMYSG